MKRSGTCCTAPVWTPLPQPLDIYRSINALCESFFATSECELLDRRRFPSQAEARLAVFDFTRAGTTRTVGIPAWTTSRR